MEPLRAHLTLDIELDSEPIEGSLIDPDNVTRPFHGWIELVSLLQAAATTPAARTDRPTALSVAARPEEVT
jgi:hypothetical protein